MRVAPNRYPPGVTPLQLTGDLDIRAHADWDGVVIAIDVCQTPLRLSAMQAIELGAWLQAAGRAIDREG